MSEMEEQIEKWARAILPPDAAVPSFTMSIQHGPWRDQSALALTGGWEAFERPLPHYLFHQMREFPGLFVDVGANTGFYTLLALAASKRNRVVAIEPIMSILDMLSKNLHENHLQERARLIGVAAGAHNGHADIFSPATSHGYVETSSSLFADFRVGHGGTSNVTVRTLDRILFRPSLVRYHVSAIKIDVELAEALVLAGAHWTIRRHRPVLFVEILRAADTKTLTEFITRFRYVDVRLFANGPPTAFRDVAFEMEAWNHAFVPAEQEARFLAMQLASAGSRHS
jgi:FkbM family methyltransferase